MTIATRVLTIRSGTVERQVAVSLDAPRADPTGGWFCRYTIGWPDDERRAEGWGVDAVQALHLTLERIGLDLYASPYHAAGELIWEIPGDGHGFPVPLTMRDETVGADRQFGTG